MQNTPPFGGVSLLFGSILLLDGEESGLAGILCDVEELCDVAQYPGKATFFSIKK